MPCEVRPDGSYATRGYGEMDRLMWALDGRLESLERRGIDLQLISPSPRAISDDKQVIGVEIARLMNGGNGESGQARWRPAWWHGCHPTGRARKRRPTRSARRSGNTAFKARACMPTSAAGRLLDLPVFANVWDTLDELGLPVFMHATTAITRETLGQYTLNTVIAWPTKVTIAATRLIFSGVSAIPATDWCCPTAAERFLRAPRSRLLRAQARGESRMSSEHHEAAEPLSHPVLLRHRRRKLGFAALFDRCCRRRPRHRD